MSKLLSLSGSQTAHAIGLAATQVTSLQEMFGSHAKWFHPGRAAQNGLLAAVIAAEDFTSSTTVLGHQHRLDEQMDTLSSGRWEVCCNAYKPFPYGILVHPVIEGCIQLHNELWQAGLSMENV